MPSVLSKQYSVYDLFMLRVVDEDDFLLTNKTATAKSNYNTVYKTLFQVTKQCNTYDEFIKIYHRWYNKMGGSATFH